MKRTLLTIVLTLLCVVAIGYHFVGNNIRFERVETSHNRTIIEDGKVVSSKDWTELFGYKISIDLVDGTYIGK